VQLESQREHVLLGEMFLYFPAGQSTTQELVDEFKNKLPVQERHSELEGPEQVRQVESQLRHFGLELDDEA